MRFRKPLLVLLVFAAACLAAGCRSGVSKHGHTLSLFLVPMYKQPAGFSSTYQQHLAFAPSAVEHAVGEWSVRAVRPVVPATGLSTAPSDEVIIPRPCGPECRLPTDDGRTISSQPTPTAQPLTRTAKQPVTITPR